MVEHSVIAVLADMEPVAILDYHRIHISRLIGVYKLAVWQFVYLCKRFHALRPVSFHMFIVLIEPACRSYFTVRGICIFFAETVCADGVIKNDCFAGFYGMRLFVERDKQF